MAKEHGESWHSFTVDLIHSSCWNEFNSSPRLPAGRGSATNRKGRAGTDTELYPPAQAGKGRKERAVASREKLKEVCGG